MKEMTFLERLAENLLEGGFVRALKARLQPVQIAKALAREMERCQVVGIDGPIAPNRYLAYLHPEDLAGFAAFQVSLERELASYLRGYATRHGFKLLGPLSVKLMEDDSAARPGRVRVEASMVDTPLAAEGSVSASHPSLEGTMEMPVIPPATVEERVSPPAREAAGAFLVDELGEVVDLTGYQISIGRAVDNDLVLESRDVSRHHAQILWDGEHYLLVDLDSTNGSFVSGQRVSRHILADGEEISFADVRFTFHLDQRRV